MMLQLHLQKDAMEFFRAMYSSDLTLLKSDPTDQRMLAMQRIHRSYSFAVQRFRLSRCARKTHRRTDNLGSHFARSI